MDLEFYYTIFNDENFSILINSDRLELDFHVEKSESEKMLPIGKRCKDQSLDEIRSIIECKREAQFLGLPWGGSFDSPNHFPACFYNQDDSHMVSFNTNPHAGSSNLKSNYFAICKAYTRGKIV